MGDVKSEDGPEITTLAINVNDYENGNATTIVDVTTVEVTTEEDVTLATNEVVLQEMKPRNSKDIKDEKQPLLEKMLPPTTVKNLDKLTNTGQVALPNLAIFL